MNKKDYTSAPSEVVIDAVVAMLANPEHWCKQDSAHAGFVEISKLIDTLRNQRNTLQKQQRYRYIGRSGIPVLARDLEDQLEETQRQLADTKAELVKVQMLQNVPDGGHHDPYNGPRYHHTSSF